MLALCCVYMFYDYCLSDVVLVFFFQAEDGIRDLVRSRGLGDVYKRQGQPIAVPSQDIVLGCYYLTLARDEMRGDNKAFGTLPLIHI